MSGWERNDGGFKRLQGRALQRRNDRIKARDQYTCQHCGRISDRDLEVDHVVPLAVSQDDSDDNLQCLCRECHALKSAMEMRGRTMHLPLWLPKPLVPVHVVCGPPGSGKSTYVRERAKATDLVLDADEIATRSTGKPLYHASKAEIEAAIRFRNTMLGRLGRQRDAANYTSAWAIVTASTPNARAFWSGYATELVVLDPGIQECTRRVMADERRPAHAKARHVEAIKAWVRGPHERELRKPPVKGCDASGIPLGGWA